MYSVLNDRWVKHPGTPIIDYNRARVERLVQAWTKLIDHALVDSREDQLTGLTQMLMNYRKLSLAKDGEFGPGNLAFKSLRNAGTLDRLHTALNTIKDSNLSLD